MNHCRNSFRHFRVFGHNHFSNGRLIAKLSKIYKKIVSLGKMSQLPTVFQGKPNLRKGFFERHVFSEFRQKMAVFRESFEVFIPRKSTDSSLIHHVSLKLTIWYMRDIFFFLPIWSVKYGWFINFHMTRISLLPFCTPFSSHILHIEALLLRQQKIGKTNRCELHPRHHEQDFRALKLEDIEEEKEAWCWGDTLPGAGKFFRQGEALSDNGMDKP